MTQKPIQPTPTDGMEPLIERERNRTLAELEAWLETPVMLLGFLWLVLLVIDLSWGLNPFLNAVMYFIWGVFVLDFLLRFTLAPRKGVFLRGNWLTALSLFIPALRIGRLARILQAARLGRALRAAQSVRGLRLVSLISSVNRGMRALRRTFERRGVGYVLLLTLVVLLVGAAGMYAFEQPSATEGDGLKSYGEALWWTAMIMTTLGSNYWPITAEGRLLALLLALYAFGVFGYVTATLATFFIGSDAAKAAAGEAPVTAFPEDTLPIGAPAEAIPVTADLFAEPNIDAAALQKEADRLTEEAEKLRAEAALLRKELSELRDELRASGSAAQSRPKPEE